MRESLMQSLELTSYERIINADLIERTNMRESLLQSLVKELSGELKGERKKNAELIGQIFLCKA